MVLALPWCCIRWIQPCWTSRCRTSPPTWRPPAPNCRGLSAS